jgi:hypothetical protein
MFLGSGIITLRHVFIEPLNNTRLRDGPDFRFHSVGLLTEETARFKVIFRMYFKIAHNPSPELKKASHIRSRLSENDG